MGRKFSDKLMGLLGFEVEEIEEEFAPEEEETRQAVIKPKSGKNNLVNIHSAKNIKIIVGTPSKFDQVQEYATDLKNRRPIILNLENVDKDTARRILDFMSGATYALGGMMRKVNANIFLFAPNNVDIDGSIPGDVTAPEFLLKV